MAVKDTLSVGVFEDLETAQRSIEDLRRAGFGQEEIGIIGQMGDAQLTVPTPAQMKAPEENAVNGMISGAAQGAVVGVLVLIVLPGLSEVTGLGRWFEILGGAILGAVAGGCLFAFASLFLSRAKSRFYQGQLEQGRFIVTVKNPERHQEALSVLSRKAVFSDKDSG
ncbi:MAG: general stress protein [Gemmataceae bacterium]|nr:general stress protein [Gemmataceae bacterium]